MSVQVSVSISFDAADQAEVLEIIKLWQMHPGASVTVMVEQPAKAITQPVMDHLATITADADGKLTIGP
jgi:hypothetical protein